MNGLVTWSPGITLEEMEKEIIIAALKFFQNNKTQTAIALGVAVRTIDNKLEAYAKVDKERDERNELERISREKFLRRQRGIIETDTVRSVETTGAQSRVGVESPSNLSPKQAVPMSVGKEVQSMSPKHATASHSRKTR